MSEYYHTAYRQVVLILGTQMGHNHPCPILEPRVDECNFEVQSTVPG